MINPEIDINNLMFIDIETVPLVETFDELNEPLRNSWENMYIKQKKSQEYPSASEFFTENAALYPEFLKIVCITIGYFNGNKLHVTDINEQKCQNEYGMLVTLNTIMSKSLNFKLMAHNGKNFDYPVLMKRYIIHSLIPFKQLLTVNAKPWESKLADSQEIWKFGSYQPNHLAGIEKICAALNIPSPKDDICGSDIAELYYTKDPNQKLVNMERISRYCNGDVVALALAVGKMNLQITDIKDIEIIQK